MRGIHIAGTAPSEADKEVRTKSTSCNLFPLIACLGFTFDLRSAQDGSQYEYQPTFNLNSSMASRLPAYLQEEIVFDADQLQLFFWRALNFLMTLPTK